MINSEYNILKDIKDDLKERNIELERIIKLEGGKNSKSYCLFLPSLTLNKLINLKGVTKVCVLCLNIFNKIIRSIFRNYSPI